MVKYDNTFPDNLITIGQNAADNDSIITAAKQNDYWFHLDKLPSPHVIICGDNPIDKQMIYYCAGLVKGRSKYKDISKVTVVYTEIKNVQKTDVAGKVMIKKERSVVI